MNNAFKYVKAVGLTTEAAYIYTSGDTGINGACKSPIPLTSGTPLFKITGHSIVSATCDAVATTVLGRPLSVAVDATNWGPYGGGVFTSCGAGLNHGVLLVGFNSTCWIIKNSWGPNWGAKGSSTNPKGYICLGVGRAYPGTCGICSSGYVSYPTK